MLIGTDVLAVDDQRVAIAELMDDQQKLLAEQQQQRQATLQQQQQQQRLEHQSSQQAPPLQIESGPSGDRPLALSHLETPPPFTSNKDQLGPNEPAPPPLVLPAATPAASQKPAVDGGTAAAIPAISVAAAAQPDAVPTPEEQTTDPQPQAQMSASLPIVSTQLAAPSVGGAVPPPAGIVPPPAGIVPPSAVAPVSNSVAVDANTLALLLTALAPLAAALPNLLGVAQPSLQGVAQPSLPLPPQPPSLLPPPPQGSPGALFDLNDLFGQLASHYFPRLPQLQCASLLSCVSGFLPSAPQGFPDANVESDKLCVAERLGTCHSPNALAQQFRSSQSLLLQFELAGAACPFKQF